MTHSHQLAIRSGRKTVSYHAARSRQDSSASPAKKVWSFEENWQSAEKSLENNSQFFWQI
jgi:hypothetical protein